MTVLPLVKVAVVVLIPAPALSRLESVPNEVREDAVTPEASVDPVRVPAAAVTVMAAEPSKFTPFIALAVARVVAVEAFPVRAPVKVDAVMLPVPVIVGELSDRPESEELFTHLVPLYVSRLFVESVAKVTSPRLLRFGYTPDVDVSAHSTLVLEGAVDWITTP
jgi:hypothetical protein